MNSSSATLAWSLVGDLPVPASDRDDTRDFTLTLESVMTKRLASLRCQAARRQSYHCYYCNLPMWEKDPTKLIARLSLSKAQAALFRCTAEHLHAKSQGGPDSSANILAACHFCNRNRHAARRALDPHEYKQHVTNRMNSGRWLASMPRVATLLKSEA